MPQAQREIYNRGNSGNSIADLRTRWQKDAIEMKPDLLSILIGTNDVGSGVQVDSFEADYRRTQDASRKSDPDMRPVLLDPFALRSGKLKDEIEWTSRRSAIDELGRIAAQLANDYQVVHIKTQGVFDAPAKAVSPK